MGYLVSALCGVCLAGTILGIQFMSSGSTRDMGIALFLMGAIATVILIRNELRKKCGFVLSPDLWLDSTFLRTCLISGLLGLSLTAFYLPLVFLLDVRMNFGSIAISAIMITIALSNALVGPFAGHISDRREPEVIIRFGLVLFAFANFLLGLIGILLPRGSLAFVTLCAVMMIGGVGTGLTFAPLANIALGQAQAETVGRAAAFYNCARQVSSALGGVIVAIVFDLIVRLQLGYGIEITATSLRESSKATAIASSACFLLIAFCLATAAKLSRSAKQKSIDKLEQN